MKKTTGIISFLGAIITVILLIYALIEGEGFDESEKEELLIWIGFFVFSICVIYYCFSSKFWTSKISDIEISDNGNKLIKKQIEKRELLIKKLRKIQWTRKLFKFPTLLSLVALLISALGIYFQFFNERHSILYTTLTPEYSEESRQLTIPLLLKNTGNQTEIILNSELQLEVKESEGSFFKRISPLKNKERYLILAPGDNKTINLVGNYEDYFLGTFIIEDVAKHKSRYSPITVFDSLLLTIKIGYLTTYGTVASEEREIGKISFNQDQTISRIDYNPIELKELYLSNNEIHIVSNSFTPRGYEIPLTELMKDSTMTKDKLERIIKNTEQYY